MGPSVVNLSCLHVDCIKDHLRALVVLRLYIYHIDPLFQLLSLLVWDFFLVNIAF